MTTPEKHAPRRLAVSAAAAVLGALALAGCTATHVGDSWQCPLAQGKVCASVAAADPAVPAPAEGGPVLPEPLYRTWDAGDAGAEDAPPVPERPCDAACGGFDPFAWLDRLLATGGGNAEPSSLHEAAPASAAGLPAESAAQSSAPPPSDGTRTDAGTTDARTEAAAPVSADTSAVEAAALPAPPDPAAGDLRTGEVVARIWIAPFVDADGVYREASHVRVVLEPAGWRVP